MALRDSFGREIVYLRVSVTEACNLRCAYCFSPEGIPEAGEVLSRGELLRLLACAVSLGLVHIRLTGGEPLLREDIVSLIQGIAALPGLQSLSLTTNGILLGTQAVALRSAGLQRINLSLDTLCPKKYQRLTQGGSLEQALEGLRQAREAGFESLKLNTVVLGGFNEDEVLDFVRLAEHQTFSVRFIEAMPFGGARTQFGFLPVGVIRERIGKVYPLLPSSGNYTNGPSRDFIIPGFKGTVGFIAPISERFCGRCNRLRLTARGGLRPCLDSGVEVDLRGALRAGAGEETLRELFREAVLSKPEKHSNFVSLKPGAMINMGG